MNGNTGARNRESLRLDADSEEQLIADARDGSVPAFERLYRMHSARVHGLCIRLCDNRADAQDATQETFIKAWRALERFRGESSFSTWLHRIAFNESVGLRRRQGSRQASLHLVEETGVGGATALTELDQLERALARLPDRAREAVVLHKVYGYTHEETAEFMGITAGASKAQVHRAIKLLRARFPDGADDLRAGDAESMDGRSASE